MTNRPLRMQLCDIGQRMWQRGYCAGTDGNLSVRIGENRVICTPTGISKGFMQPADMVLIDLEGQPVGKNARGRKPTSEIKVHLAIYHARPRVGAVIHSHAPHATAFALAEVAPPTGVYPEAELFLGQVAVTKYATPSTAELPASILKVLKPGTNSVLLGHHGAVNFGRDLLEAYHRLEMLDSYCRITLLSRQVGPVKKLSPRKLAELREIRLKYGW